MWRVPCIVIVLLALGCAGPRAPRPAVDAQPDPKPDQPLVASPPVAPEPDDPAGEPPAPQEEPDVRILALLPFEDVDQEAIDTVTQAVGHAYGWEIRVMEPHDLPDSAWYALRKRHRAEKLLDYLDDVIPQDVDGIMGLTRKDISTTKGEIEDWGICGLAESPGLASVVSTYRIKKKLGKGSHDQKKKKYLQRLRDLANHEFGHTLGLPHCPNEGCVMEDAKGTVLTFDHSTGQLCDDCVKLLGKLGFPLPEY